MAKSADGNIEKVVAENRKARHDYFFLDTWEAGIALKGSEVKSCREGNCNLADSYAQIKNGEIWLLNSHIAVYAQANQFNHEPKRDRKLLLHKNEIFRIQGKLNTGGLTLVPVKMYFKGGKLKIELALAKGKKQYDKREDIKKRDIDREMRREKF
jgi:SsrA-binding protein